MAKASFFTKVFDLKVLERSLLRQHQIQTERLEQEERTEKGIFVADQGDDPGGIVVLMLLDKELSGEGQHGEWKCPPRPELGIPSPFQLVHWLSLEHRYRAIVSDSFCLQDAFDCKSFLLLLTSKTVSSLVGLVTKVNRSDVLSAQTGLLGVKLLEE